MIAPDWTILLLFVTGLGLFWLEMFLPGGVVGVAGLIAMACRYRSDILCPWSRRRGGDVGNGFGRDVAHDPSLDAYLRPAFS